MDNSLGGGTQDLLALQRDHPAERDIPEDAREAATQAWGKRSLRIGCYLTAGSFFGALISAVLTENQIFHTRAGAIFGILAFLAVAIVGAAFIAAGNAERMHRPMRALSRQILLEGQARDEQIGLLVDMVSQIPHRLAAIEEVVAKVPGYTEGVMEGAELAKAVFGEETRGL